MAAEFASQGATSYIEKKKIWIPSFKLHCHLASTQTSLPTRHRHAVKAFSASMSGIGSQQAPTFLLGKTPRTMLSLQKQCKNEHSFIYLNYILIVLIKEQSTFHQGYVSSLIKALLVFFLNDCAICCVSWSDYSKPLTVRYTVRRRRKLLPYVQPRGQSLPVSSSGSISKPEPRLSHSVVSLFGAAVGHFNGQRVSKGVDNNAGGVTGYYLGQLVRGGVPRAYIMQELFPRGEGNQHHCWDCGNSPTKTMTTGRTATVAGSMRCTAGDSRCLKMSTSWTWCFTKRYWVFWL